MDFDPDLKDARFPVPPRRPPFPPCPRGPAGPPGPPGPPGPHGTINDTALCFAYAQLAHLLEQLILYYPGAFLYVFMPGISPWYIAGVPQQVYRSSEGTYGGLFVIGDGGTVAIPLSAIQALQFDTAVYNPAITYLPKPNFPPGCDTNILTAVYDYIGSLPEVDITIDCGSNVYSTGPLYLNKYGIIVQADGTGNDPSFIPVMQITAIGTPELSEEASVEAASAAEEGGEPHTRIQRRTE